MSGGGSGSSAPASTTSNSTNTVIQEAPAYEQQYITDLLGQAQTAASQPYQQFPGQQVADLTPDQTQAFSDIENMVNGGAAQTAGTQATNSATAGANTANSIYGAGSPYYQASTAYNPLATASPLINAAANATTPQGISSYLSPYTNNVITGLENTANQNWNQNIMPGVNNEFVSAGQSGSGRNAQVLGQAANEEQTNLDTSVANALESGYGQASTNAANAASNLGNLANTTASATSAQASNLQNAGAGLGNLASTQAGAQGNAATNLANTASTVQNTGITGASALQAVGQQQQNQNQTNINSAMTNFQNEVAYPEQQLGFLSNIVNGLPSQTSTTGAAQTPTTTSQIGSTSPLSSLAGTLIGAGATGAKRGGLMKGYAAGGMVDDDIPPPPPSGIVVDADAPTDIPSVNASDLSPLAHASNDNATSEAPSTVSLSASTGPSVAAQSNNPLRTVDPEVTDSGSQGRNMQLLSIARGLLTPAHSGAEALGNGIGDYLKTSTAMPSYNLTQQDVASKKLGNYQQLYGMALQNARMQQMGGPQIPLPNVPGVPSFNLPPSTVQNATTSANGNITPSAAPNSTQEGSQSGLIPNNQIFGYLNNPQLLATVTPAQARQLANAAPMLGMKVPDELAKYAYAGQIKSDETTAQQSAEMPFVGPRAAAEAKAKAMYPATITARQNETTYAPFAGIQVNGAQSGVGNGGAGYMTNPSIGPIQNAQLPQEQTTQVQPSSTISDKIAQAVSTPAGQGSYGTPPSSRLTSVPKDVTDWVKEYPTQRDALAQQMSSITTINNSINGLSGNGLVGMGAGAEGRRDFANAVNTAQKIAGVSDPNLMYSPDKIANADEFTKSSLALAQARAKQLGARVTNFEMSSAQKQNPSLTMPELSARLLTNINGEGVQREIDRQDFIQNSIKNGISPSDATKNFEQIASPDLYVKRAQSQILPVKVSSPSDLGNLMPGTKVMDAKGRTGYVPIPPNYPLHVMPINPLYKGQ
jgi:hypothetical protein